MKTVVTSAAVAMTLLFAAPAGATGKKVDICHKPGTSAEKTLTVPKQAVPGHLDHGDYLGECKTPPVVTPPTTPPPTTPPPVVVCPPLHPCPALPPGCPPTTVVTIINNVTIIDQGATVPTVNPPATVPCVTKRNLLFYSPTGRLGKVKVWIDGKHQRTVRLHFKRSAVWIKGLDTAGAGDKARMKIKAIVRKRDKTIDFRWHGSIHRCGGPVIVDP